MRLFACAITVAVAEEHTETLRAGDFFDPAHHGHGEHTFQIVGNQPQSGGLVDLEAARDHVRAKIELANRVVNTLTCRLTDMGCSIKYLGYRSGGYLR